MTVAPRDAQDAPRIAFASWADPRWTHRISDSCLMVCDRISGEDSKQALTQVVQGLFEALDTLATTYGIDARAAVEWLGGRAELLRRLEHEAVEHATTELADEKKTITTKVLVVTDLQHRGLVLVLQTGSGTKIDTDYHQPSTVHLARVIHQHRPEVLFTREWSRTGRNGFGMGPIMEELRLIGERVGRAPGFGAKDLTLQELTSEGRSSAFRSGESGREDAKSFALRALLAAQKTSATAHHGRVPYAGTGTAPPGFACAVVLPDAFEEGGPQDWPDVSLKPGSARYLYVDTPSYRPNPLLVRTGRALVVRPDGTPAPDQAANVVEFLSRFGTRDADGVLWDHLRCARGLVAGHYSTEALRNQHRRPDAEFVLDSSTPTSLRRTARNICRSILTHLDEYESGTFTLAMPGQHGETVTVSGLFPPDGRWLEPGRHAQIRAYLTDLRPVPNRPALVFSGHPITFNGAPARLEATVRGGPPRYHVVQEDGHRAGSRHAPIPPVPHDLLREALADAFLDDVPLPRLVPDEAPLAELEAIVAQAERELVAHGRVQQRRLALLEQDDVVDAVTIQAMSHRYAQGVAETLTLERAAVRARTALEEALTPHPTGVNHERLLDLLRALADPRSLTARQLVRDALTLDIEHDAIHEPGHVPRRRLTLTGELAIHNGRDTFSVPLHASHEGGPAAKVPPRLAHAVASLREGIPLPDSLGADWRRWLPQIRTSLGPAGRTTRAHVIDDSRLLRLYMLVIHPPSPDPGPDPLHPRLAAPPVADPVLADLAARNGEPVALLRRIAEVYRIPPPGHRWLRDPAPALAAAYRLAATTGRVDPVDVGRAGAARQLLNGPYGREWHRVAGGLVLDPCPECGGTDRVPLRMREADGALCRICRTDRSRVSWPSDYDRYGH